MALSVVSVSTVEPVTVAEFKTHQRIDHNYEDDYVAGLITAARQHCEAYLNRNLTVGTNSLRLSMDSFKDPDYLLRDGSIYLPRPPLAVSTSVVVTYLSSEGSTGTTVGTSVYVVDSYSEPARVRSAYGESWPTPIAELNAVTMTFTAGYTTAADVPGGVKKAIKILAGDLYEHREAVSEASLFELPFGIKALLDPHKWGM